MKTLWLSGLLCLPFAAHAADISPTGPAIKKTANMPLEIELRNGVAIQALAGTSTPVFGEITNTGKEPVVLVGASSPMADQVLLQVYVRDKQGVMGVKPASRMELKPKQKISLKADEQELWLTGVKDKLEPGNEIPLAFKSDDGRQRMVRVKIIGEYLEDDDGAGQDE